MFFWDTPTPAFIQFEKLLQGFLLTVKISAFNVDFKKLGRNFIVIVYKLVFIKASFAVSNVKINRA